MLVPDLLHEFELGVWKAIFIHLIRILYSFPNGNDLIIRFNDRYETIPLPLANTKLTYSKRWRQIPTFGRDTIRRFTGMISQMKKLAARDLEDLLQVKPIIRCRMFSLIHSLVCYASVRRSISSGRS